MPCRLDGRQLSLMYAGGTIGGFGLDSGRGGGGGFIGRLR